MARPRFEPQLDEHGNKKKMEGLFQSFPHGTLAALATGTGVIALFTLLLEVATGQALAQALEMNIAYVSMPMGVATMILAGLTARAKLVYALPALAFGVAYWAVFWLS